MFEQDSGHHEKFVDVALVSLRYYGWTAERFGQGQLSEDAREVLRHYRDESGQVTPLRWMPDIIAVREPQRGCSRGVVLLDAKTRPSYPDTWAINENAIEALEAFGQVMRVPVYFLMDDFTVWTPMEVRAGTRKAGRKAGEYFYTVSRSTLSTSVESAFGYTTGHPHAA